MLIVLLIVFVTLFVLGSKFIDEYDHDFCRFGVQFATVACSLVTIGMIVFMSVGLSETMVIDEKIAMYERENKNIESQIDLVVEKYMDYESGTLKELKGDSSIALVSLYPELKSDTLVQSQITTYQNNNAKLKSLKETKINAKVYKWWLYFG